MNIIQSDLNFKFSEIDKEKDTSKLFIRIADYGRYILDYKILDAFAKDFKKQSEKDLKGYILTCDRFYVKWKELTTDLLDRAEKPGIVDSNDPIQRSVIAELKATIDSKPSYEDDYFSRQYRNYLDLLNKLATDKNLAKFIPQHIILDEDYKKYILSPYFDETQTEWERFEKIRDISVWWARIQIMRLTHGFYGIEDKGGYFSNNRIIAGLYKLDFDKIAKGNTSNLFFLKSPNYFQWVKILHNFLIVRIEALPENVDKTEIKGVAKLNYYSKDELAEYKGNKYKFKGKGRALLNGLYESRNLPLSFDEIAARCNPSIKIGYHHFRGEKDIYDTVEYIKEKLKVNKNEYFPIRKVEASWIWDQK